MQNARVLPTTSKLLHDAGILDYVIFLDEQTGILFASQSVHDDFDPDAITRLPIMQKWWRYMADLMLVNEDSSPVINSLKLAYDSNL